jgi:hypothetical protein
VKQNYPSQAGGKGSEEFLNEASKKLERDMHAYYEEIELKGEIPEELTPEEYKVATDIRLRFITDNDKDKRLWKLREQSHGGVDKSTFIEEVGVEFAEKARVDQERWSDIEEKLSPEEKEIMDKVALRQTYDEFKNNMTGIMIYNSHKAK